MKKSLLYFFLSFSLSSLSAQVCSGSLGAPVFFEDFGSGVALYGPPLPASVTAYPFVSGSPVNGSYAISKTANPANILGYVPDGDHTGNPNGYMMVVNADYGSTNVYKQNVTGLCPNTTYVVSAFFANNNTPSAATLNCGGGYIYPNIKIQIEYPASVFQASTSTGNLPLAANNLTLNWQQSGLVFTTGPSQTSCDFVLINNAPGGCGNDYVVDDISFSPCGPGIGLNVLPTNSLCAGLSATIQSSFTVGSYTVPQYQWQYSNDGGVSWTNIGGATTSSYVVPAMSATNTGLYRLLAAENGNINLPNCRVIAGHVTLTMSLPTTTVAVTNGTCGTSSASVYASGGSGSGYTYTWLPAGGNLSLTVASLASGNSCGGIGLTAGIYTVLVKGNGSNSCTTSNTLVLAPTSTISLNVSVSSPTVCTGSGQFTVIASSSYSPGFAEWNIPNPNAPFPAPAGGNTISQTVNQTSWLFHSAISGIHTFTVKACNYIGCYASQVFSINALPQPTLNVSSTPVLCNGETSTLTVTGANTYTWLPANISGDTFTVNPLVNTTYSVIGTGTTECSPNPKTVTLTVPPPLQTILTASTPSICIGSSPIILTVNSSGGTGTHSYTWSTASNSNTISVSESAGNYIYSVQTQDENLCTDTKTISLDFIANPTLTVPNATVCKGSAVTLTATGANAYVWNTGSTSSNPVVSPTINSVYTATGSVLGCTAVASASVEVLPVPVLSFSSAAITCTGLGSATVEASGTTGPYSYTWTPTAQTTSNAINMYPGVFTVSVLDAGNGCLSSSSVTFTPLLPFTGTVSATNSLTCHGATTGTASIAVSNGSGSQNYAWTNILGTQTTPTANMLGGGVHTVTVIDNLTYCTVTQTFLIAQPPAFTLNVTASSPTACTGQSITLNANTSGGTPNYSYTWTPNIFSNTQVVSFTTAGLHTYTVTSSDFYDCKITKTISVQFLQTPSVSASNATICQNAVATLTAVGANSYTWFPNLAVGNTFTDSPNSTRFYTVTGNSLGCFASANASVLVYPLPTAKILSNASNSNICSGYNLTLTASGGATYSWSSISGLSSSSSSLVIPNMSFSNAGTYSLTAFSQQGCMASTQTDIHIIPSPTPAVSGASVCIGESAVISVSGGMMYQWNGPNSFSSFQSTVFISSVNANSMGIYTVVVTGTNLCKHSATVNLLGYPYPLPTPVISGNTKACANSQFQLNAEGGVVYYWQGAQNFSSSSPTIHLFANENTSGIYTLTVRNASNCAASKTVELITLPLPNAFIKASNDYLCVPFCTNFSLQNQNNSSPITSVNYRVNAVNTHSNYCITQAGAHQVSATFKDANGCVNSSQLTLSAYPKPDADFHYSPQEPLEGMDLVQFRDTSRGEDITKWRWFFKDSTTTVFSEQRFPTHLYENAGIYPVALVVENRWNCADTMIKAISIKSDYSFYLPNTFTPNNDNLNDVFQPKGFGIKQYHMSIYDRWGHLIFTTDDFYQGWDGTLKGEECPNDIYVWKATVITATMEEKSFVGSVRLVR
ncbi:MAG: gliding motility-associated C-terminal domain-containing protein [Bacteroidetes bacterium]|nr:gliding motility-associated C-terminal domain-containing protein [Bacteroidota bacterium]